MSRTVSKLPARSTSLPARDPIPRYCQYLSLIVSVPHFCWYRFVATDVPAITRGNYPCGGVLTMATASTPAPAQAPEPKSKPEQVAPRPTASASADGAPRRHLRFRKYLTPALVLLLAAALVLTLTRNWNAWEGGRIEQVTDDAYVRSDLTPLSTKVSGIVREVKDSDYQTVAKGDLIVELEHDDYQAQLDQAKAAVEAAKAGIENNRRQRQLQDAKIDRALSGIDQAKAP